MNPPRPNRPNWPVKGEIVLRKDAKIAIVVILLLMVVVVIIWGQNPRPDTAADPYADQTTITIANNPAPATPDDPPDAPADTIADLRRHAPTAPPTNADAAPDQPVAMMNNLPPRAELIHEGAPPPPDRTASDALAIGPTDRPRPVRDASGDLIPLAEKPLPKPDPKPAFLAIHTIVKGDSYTKLAAKYYSDGRKWRHIYDANKIPPQSLTIGRRIKIPHLPKPKAAPEPVRAKGTPLPPATGDAIARKLAAAAPDRPAKATKAAGKSYTVKKGESFYSIARKIYRDPTLWKKLYEHNRARLPKPADPASLRAGTVIELPNLTG